VDEEGFRDIMARLPAGVVVVAAPVPGGFRGLTASSLTAVSLQPPLILVCLDRNSATLDAVAAGGRFSVSLLAADQEFAAERFSGRGPTVDPGWREVPHSLTRAGLPILAGAVAWIECSVEARHDGGDHEIVVGRVLGAGMTAGEPLIHWNHEFWRLAPG